MKRPVKKTKKPAKKTAQVRVGRARAKSASRAVASAQVAPLLRREERPAPQAQNGAPTGLPAGESHRTSSLPNRYGDNSIWLMVRDPHWLFTYWEIRPDVEEDALRRLGGSRAEVASILRIYDITDRGRTPAFFDITLRDLAEHWYIEVGANRSYVVEIGLLHRDGRFVALARSNEVTTPRDGMSDVLDEEWMDIDFDKVYALSGGFQVGLSSQELQKQMRQRLEGAVTSGSGAAHVSSLSSHGRAEKKRKFWFVVDCELIVYGATEPDAAVTINGQPIELRPDGTFTLRYALPDGRVRVDARAHSADGVEERQIVPDVERKTYRPEPVFKGRNGAKA